MFHRQCNVVREYAICFCGNKAAIEGKRNWKLKLKNTYSTLLHVIICLSLEDYVSHLNDNTHTLSYIFTFVNLIMFFN